MVALNPPFFQFFFDPGKPPNKVLFQSDHRPKNSTLWQFWNLGLEYIRLR